MQFLSPWFFAAFAALAIPVIIHLLNLRKPETLRFSTVAFFKVLQQSTIRRIKIKKWILLAIRLLAITMLVLALLRPFMPTGYGSIVSSNQPRLYLILADNSLSMSQIDVNGPYIQQLQNFLSTLVENSGPRDQFVLAPTNGEWQLRGRLDAGRFMQAVKELEPVAKGNYISERLNELIQTSLEPGEQAPILFVLSDGQTSQLEPLRQRTITDRQGRDPLPVQFIQVGSTPVNNTAITDIKVLNRILGTGKPVILEVDVTNYGQDPVSNVFLTLESDAQQGGQYTLELKAGESKSYLFELRPNQAGHISGKAYLDGDRFAADDQRYFSLPIPESIPVLYVSDNSGRSSSQVSYLLPVLRAGEENSGRFQITTSRSDQLPSLNSYQIIVLDGLAQIPEAIIENLLSFVQEGNSLIILPGERGVQSSYNRFLQRMGAPTFQGTRGEYNSNESITRFGRLGRDHPVLDDLFELDENEDIRIENPDFYYYWLLNAQNADRARILFESNLAEPMIVEQPYGSGLALLTAFGTDPGWSNLPTRPIFAPLFYRMLLYASARDLSAGQKLLVGQGLDITERSLQQEIEIELNGTLFKPEIRQTRMGTNIRYQGQEWMPGVLNVRSGNQIIKLALNLPADESNFKISSSDQIQQYYNNDLQAGDTFRLDGIGNDYKTYFESAAIGREVWHLFLLFGILLLMLESFISRWYKAENV
jgi:hypothetical protein